MKVKVKRPKNYRITVTFVFDDRPSKTVSHEGTSKDIDEFMDNADELDAWEDELEAAKDHITELSMRVQRL